MCDVCECGVGEGFFDLLSLGDVLVLFNGIGVFGR